jgi:hypothetical protein
MHRSRKPSSSKPRKSRRAVRIVREVAPMSGFAALALAMSMSSRGIPPSIATDSALAVKSLMDSAADPHSECV